MTRSVVTRLLVALLLVLGPVCAATFAADIPQSMDIAELNDEELSAVTAGQFAINVEGFDVTIQDNQAGDFTLDIAQNAFDSASGLFTTVQAVNSAVSLSMIVNIYINQPTS